MCDGVAPWAPAVVVAAGGGTQSGDSLCGHSMPPMPPHPFPAGRTNTRSGWAAQVAQDAGLQHCLVLRQGVCGWRLDPAVKPYRGYRLQDVPPEAEAFVVEPLNAEAGRAELAQLGIPVM